MVVPKEFRKTFCLSAGWISLLEAVVFEAVCVYVIGSYDCAWNFLNLQSGVTAWSMLDITYIMGQCKGDAGALQLGYLMSPPARPAKSLQVWLWIYAILTAAWIPACILLIVSAMGEVRGRHAAMLYYPWISLTTTLVVIDLAGAIYHLVDVFHTTTPDDYATFTGVQNWNILTVNTSTNGITSWLPSLIVTLFFCRFLLLWILNIYFICGTYKASNAVSMYKTKFIQNTDEKKKSWKEKFHDGPEPASIEQQTRSNVTSRQARKNEDVEPKTPVTVQKENRSVENEARYRVDEFGIPVEELNTSEPREINITKQNSGVYNLNENNFSRSPYHPTGRVFDFTGRPVRPESISDRWQDNAPPMASGVQVPPELNKFEPFSYTAGDQPQLMRRPVSRSNSKSKPEYPPIPRPDYTIADRSSSSLEYIPNRFKVPSPKRTSQLQSTFTYNSPGSPNSPRSPKAKVAPASPRKPVIYPRSTPPIPEDTAPQTRYITQPVIPSQPQSYYTRQTSTSNNYNINRLY